MRVTRWIVSGLAAALVVIQFVPYGRDHTNPPVTQDAPWPSAEARQLAVRACYDCHSNETRWPWYSNVAPMSWFVQDHIDDGRNNLNFSEWDRPQDTDELAESVREGEMPLRSYLVLHSSARLSGAEREELLAALGVLAPEGGEGGENDD